MNDASIEAMTFEQALAELERVVRTLEEGKVSLEDALTHYERGIGLLKRCYGRLQQAEQKIAVLTGQDERGQPLLRPLEHSPALAPGNEDAR